jgi:hypothetical protein
MDCRDDNFRVLNAEGINRRSILLPHPRAAQRFSRIVLFGVILKTERESTSQRTAAHFRTWFA